MVSDVDRGTGAHFGKFDLDAGAGQTTRRGAADGMDGTIGFSNNLNLLQLSN